MLTEKVPNVLSRCPSFFWYDTHLKKKIPKKIVGVIPKEGWTGYPDLFAWRASYGLDTKKKKLKKKKISQLTDPSNFGPVRDRSLFMTGVPAGKQHFTGNCFVAHSAHGQKKFSTPTLDEYKDQLS